MSSKLIIALDYPSAEQALSFVKQLSPSNCKLKVGFELFVASGPDFVKQLIDMGYDIFLDLKFHDIPNTVASVCQSAASLGVWMMNVHACGGDIMMKAARQALIDCNSSSKLIAVTVLTSMDQTQLERINISVNPENQVKHLAQLTKDSALDGVVCSAQEAKILRKQAGDDFLLVTPGIRPEGAEAGDQKRLMTPYQANKAGVSYIVVGRPITLAKNPLEVIEQINLDMA
ncbi:MAG TPA: orotidine-5'-phosphate decarboxylase [Leucothrix sp.]|nr:orotidine-5'-phosphate decarboxylase [Leucothrix sp.]